MDLGKALLARGEDVRFMSLNETEEELPEPFRSRTALLNDPYGWLSDVASVAKRLEGMFTGSLFEDGWIPETSIILGDVGSLKISPVLSFVPKDFPVWHYVPIEGIGLPPRWANLWRIVRPVAMSEFGADEIAKVTGTRPPVVYHGVDTKAFHPASAATPIRFISKTGVVTALRSRAECREFLGWPQDEFIMFRADRNMPRKAYDHLFRALAPVLARNPKARLIWHCLTLDQGGDLLDERSKYPESIALRMNSTGYHDQFNGVQREILAAMYNAADLYVSTSAEGFGLTIAESLACGVPAVGIDFSAVPEVIGKAGRVVKVGALIPNIYSHFWAVPDARLFGETVEELMRDTAARRVMGALGPLHIGTIARWDRAAEQFSELVAVREAVAA
jgi:glycosyltransferase involved in cell wall biosynthesis